MLFQQGQWFHFWCAFLSALQMQNQEWHVPLAVNHQLRDEHIQNAVTWKHGHTSHTVCNFTFTLLTSTILAHWVPLPAPGPPRTKTTSGFSPTIVFIRLTIEVLAAPAMRLTLSNHDVKIVGIKEKKGQMNRLVKTYKVVRTNMRLYETGTRYHCLWKIVN